MDQPQGQEEEKEEDKRQIKVSGTQEACKYSGIWTSVYVHVYRPGEYMQCPNTYITCTITVGDAKLSSGPVYEASSLQGILIRIAP